MAWTIVPTPSAGNYTRVNPQGRQQYDEAALTYDDINVFYDSTNEAAWTSANHPGVTDNWVKIANPT